MARRLTAEARRAEILQRTKEMIAEQGPENLSLRGVARWCNMSAPGVLHHFQNLQELLVSVLQARHQEEVAAFTEALPANPTLRDWADTVARVSMKRVEENRSFDALETQALANPEHPAHDLYVHEERPYPTTVMLAKREYPRDPEAVARVLTTVVDGLRLRWLREPEPRDYLAEWSRIADTVFAGFEQYRA